MAKIQKVTDPVKIVTDPVLLSVLTRQGVDKDYVEAFQDYASAYVDGKRVKERSPYAKFYRDLKSNKRFAAFSGLPAVTADGTPVICGWAEISNQYESKSNLFSAKVDGGRVTLTCVNDQPTGIMSGDSVTFLPQVFLDGAEKKSKSLSLLAVDPLDENYSYNTLEWDFGICKRRLRIIEGRLLGSWVFTVPPQSDILIKYNQSGKFALRLQYAKDSDTEFIPKEFFAEAEYPLTIFDSAIFYPDAHPETSSVDGFVQQLYSAGSGVDWSTIVADAGNGAGDADSSARCARMIADTIPNKWVRLSRSIFLFDTSSLPDDAAISAATFSIRGNAKEDALSATPNINVYSSAPALNTALAAGDFDSLGSTDFCDTPITYGGYSTVGYNDFALNAAGIAAISKTGVTKLGCRNANYDVADSPPPWVSGAASSMSCYFAEQGNGFKPALVVTYTPGVTYKDIATRFNLFARNFKDITTRFRLTVRNYLDALTRFRLIAQSYKDIPTRFKLNVQGYRDTATRFLLTVQGYQDIATRFRLWAQSYLDIATRFRLEAQSYLDIATRFRLLGISYQDIATRFQLNAQAFRDTSIRFRLTIQAYRDIATRFLLILPSFRDVATRFRLIVTAQYRDAGTRFFLYVPTWKELQIQKEITAIEQEVAKLRKPKAVFAI